MYGGVTQLKQSTFSATEIPAGYIDIDLFLTLVVELMDHPLRRNRPQPFFFFFFFSLFFFLAALSGRL